MDKNLLTANTKEELTDKVRQHLTHQHHVSVSRNEVMLMVNQVAQQAA